MYSGLIGPSPFIAALIIAIFLEKGFASITSADRACKIIAILWSLYILVLSYIEGNFFVGALVNSTIQVFMMYWYLKISDLLEERIIMDILFLVLGSFVLIFFYAFIQALFAI